MSLTAKQRVFVEEYLRTWNATSAAKAAGYSEKTARSIGQENLTKPDIAAEVKRRLSERAMPADEVLARTADIARGDLTEWIDADGRLDVPALKAAGKGYLLKKYRVTRRTHTTKGGDETETVTTEVELYPADAAHDRLMRYHGLYNDKVRVTDWQDEVIDLLRRRELEPADVRAAYPDLADDFFARAGIQVHVDDRPD